MISDTSPEEGSYKVVKSPVRLVVILAVVIFMIEVLVMLLVLSVPGLVGWRAAFVDAALLVILVTPVLYTAAVIPMVRYNVKLDKMEAERNSFFECSLDMLCIAHTDGYFKRINPAFEETLGWSTAELLARPFLDFIHPDDLAATLVEVDKLAAGESVISFQNRYQCKDGSWRWLSWKSTATSEGAIFATARDITEIELTQEALRESEEKYRTVFESSADAIMTIAPPLWNFTSANPATLEHVRVCVRSRFLPHGAGSNSRPNTSPMAALRLTRRWRRSKTGTDAMARTTSNGLINGSTARSFRPRCC